MKFHAWSFIFEIIMIIVNLQISECAANIWDLLYARSGDKYLEDTRLCFYINRFIRCPLSSLTNSNASPLLNKNNDLVKMLRNKLNPFQLHQLIRMPFSLPNAKRHNFPLNTKLEYRISNEQNVKQEHQEIEQENEDVLEKEQDTEDDTNATRDQTVSTPSFKGSNEAIHQYILSTKPIPDKDIVTPTGWYINTRRLSDGEENNTEYYSIEPLPTVTLTQSTIGAETTTFKVDQKTETSQNAIIGDIMPYLDVLERMFYNLTFCRTTSRSPESRRENGVSFVQSGLLLYLALTGLANHVDPNVRNQIEAVIGPAKNKERTEHINQILSWLPITTQALRIRWNNRLVFGSGQKVQNDLAENGLNVNYLNRSDPATIVTTLNNMIKTDSGGALRDTLNEDDFPTGLRVALLTVLYFRPQWTTSPTLLNGSIAFRDSESAPNRTTKMIRLNQDMGYRDITEWDAEAIEVPYSTPGLSLLMIIPRGRSLRNLARNITIASLQEITNNMAKLRVSVTLPIFTLRVTVLMPETIKAMGMPNLIANKTKTKMEELKLSHALQRMMFWSEPGRKAYKDYGSSNWDEPSEKKLFVDRPYVFFVRWKNVTILTGNFVL